MKLIYLFFLTFLSFFGLKAQENYLKIHQTINLPKDSVESKKLISDFTEFLLQSQKQNTENKFVNENSKLETFVVLDELKNIEKSSFFKSDTFYKPYLTNVLNLTQQKYLLQVSYIGVSDNNPILKASFRFLADKVNNSFRFSSPLLENTKDWKTLKVNNNIFYYKNSINKKKLKEFSELTAKFDKKLNLENDITNYYCCENILELESILGVDYKLDYNGRTKSVWSTSDNHKFLVILGNNNSNFDNFDQHDLWHERLSMKIARNKVNKPVDEGCAYIYGGSWGLSWNKIFEEFKKQIAINKNIDWVEIKEKPIFFKTDKYENSADYIINALLVKKIEKEKGFAGVWELLNIGPYEKGNEKYYKTLEKLTGITKENYNQKVWELINKEN